MNDPIRAAVEAASALVGAVLEPLTFAALEAASKSSPPQSSPPQTPALSPPPAQSPLLASPIAAITLTVCIQQFARQILLPTFLSEGASSPSHAFVHTLLILRQFLIDNAAVPLVKARQPDNLPLPFEPVPWATSVVLAASRLRHPAAPAEIKSEEEKGTDELIDKIKRHDGNNSDFLDAWNR